MTLTGSANHWIRYQQEYLGTTDSVVPLIFHTWQTAAAGGIAGEDGFFSALLKRFFSK